jgi:hypothetical protein
MNGNTLTSGWSSSLYFAHVKRQSNEVSFITVVLTNLSERVSETGRFLGRKPLTL